MSVNNTTGTVSLRSSAASFCNSVVSFKGPEYRTQEISKRVLVGVGVIAGTVLLYRGVTRFFSGKSVSDSNKIEQPFEPRSDAGSARRHELLDSKRDAETSGHRSSVGSSSNGGRTLVVVNGGQQCEPASPEGESSLKLPEAGSSASSSNEGRTLVVVSGGQQREPASPEGESSLKLPATGSHALSLATLLERMYDACDPDDTQGLKTLTRPEKFAKEWSDVQKMWDGTFEDWEKLYSVWEFCFEIFSKEDLERHPYLLRSNAIVSSFSKLLRSELLRSDATAHQVFSAYLELESACETFCTDSADREIDAHNFLNKIMKLAFESLRREESTVEETCMSVPFSKTSVAGDRVGTGFVAVSCPQEVNLQREFKDRIKYWVAFQMAVPEEERERLSFQDAIDLLSQQSTEWREWQQLCKYLLICQYPFQESLDGSCSKNYEYIVRILSQTRMGKSPEKFLRLNWFLSGFCDYVKKLLEEKSTLITF